MPVIRCMSITSDGELISLGGADGQISVHYSDGRLERHWEGHCEGICLKMIEIDDDTNDWLLVEGSLGY